MTHHRLKTWPEYYDAVAAGRKTFEVRIDDRNYQPGDQVTLACWDPGPGEFDGRELTFGVPYVLLGHGSGIQEGYAVLSLAPVPGEPAGDQARQAYLAYAHALGNHRTPGWKDWEQLDPEKNRDRIRAWRAVAATAGDRERRLAAALLRLADDAGMPDTHWRADSRVLLARQVLGVPEDGRGTHAHLWDDEP